MPRYQTDPVVEALCEFRFEEAADWDLTVFGAFREQIGERLPHREQHQAFELTVPAQDDRDPQPQPVPRMRFYDESRERLAQVGPHLLVVNVLRPYPHWGEFRPFIETCLDAYRKAAEPKNLRKMTLRYLDQIALDDDGSVLSTWIEMDSAYVPAFLADSADEAASFLEKPVPGGKERFSIRLNKEPREIRLDTQLVQEDVDMGEESLRDVLDAQHDRVNAIFEATISDALR